MYKLFSKSDSSGELLVILIEPESEGELLVIDFVLFMDHKQGD